eukprot:evm.model.scf_933.5 EVM.evm.TU.scf_933.5   scf_933:24955-25450(-)
MGAQSADVHAALEWFRRLQRRSRGWKRGRAEAWLFKRKVVDLEFDFQASDASSAEEAAREVGLIKPDAAVVFCRAPNRDQPDPTVEWAGVLQKEQVHSCPMIVVRPTHAHRSDGNAQELQQ